MHPEHLEYRKVGEDTYRQFDVDDVWQEPDINPTNPQEWEADLSDWAK